MTPAIRALERAAVAYQLLEYDSRAVRGDGTHDVGAAAAAALGLDPCEVFKTLVVTLDARRHAIAIVPVGARLSTKKLAAAAGARSAELADAPSAERLTGYVTGGISPLGQRRALPTYLAREGAELELLYVSAGRRGLELALAPADLVRLTAATVCDLAA